jgi:hypothetical protein
LIKSISLDFITPPFAATSFIGPLYRIYCAVSIKLIRPN